MRDPKAEGKRWLEQASCDLDAARTILEQRLWWIVCFQAQQAAEKAVKAYLYASGERLVLGHSVAELLTEAGEKDERFAAIRAQGAALDRFYIPTRYPNGLPGGIPAESYTEEDAKQAVEKAAVVFDLVDQAIER